MIFATITIVKLSNTQIAMTTDNLPKQYVPQETEAKWQEYLETTGIFHPSDESDRPPYRPKAFIME